MENTFHQQNRQELYTRLPANSLLLLFSGHAPRKTGDEDYPFFADRSFVYYTGIEQADSVLAALKDTNGVSEMLFMRRGGGGTLRRRRFPQQRGVSPLPGGRHQPGRHDGLPGF